MAEPVAAVERDAEEIRLLAEIAEHDAKIRKVCACVFVYADVFALHF